MPDKVTRHVRNKAHGIPAACAQPAYQLVATYQWQDGDAGWREHSGGEEWCVLLLMTRPQKRFMQCAQTEIDSRIAINEYQVGVSAEVDAQCRQYVTYFLLGIDEH